jgi:para-nitrobenzyl esterase
MNELMLDRRAFLGLGSGFFLSGIVRAAESRPTAVVKTTNGPVRGLLEADVHAFRGLRYAAPPVGSLRFLPPQKPKPWTDPVDAFHLAAASMQLRSGASAVSNPAGVRKALGEVFTTADDVAKQNEDCMFLNVWTPQLGGAKKRPVMVWLHGGGFNYGSGSWPAYDGHNLAKRHDVIVVTVNHRLNAFGYLYLGGLGKDDTLAISGNAGQLDLISALEWVRDNISEFGGDPGNVTIFGQSGGGAKVSCLLAMPGAKGLFHRAIIESGPGLRGATKDEATATAQAICAQLQINPGDVNALQAVPAEKLTAAVIAVQAKGGGGIGGLRFGPVVDGIALPTHPFDPVAPSLSASIPVMVGCTKDEQTIYNVGQPWWGKLTDVELAEKAKAAVGPKADALIAAFRKLRPNDSPSYLFTDTTTAAGAFIGSVRLAERKAALKAAPAYLYVFQWGSPADDGILRAPHTMEIPFAFDNIDKGPTFVGNSAEAQKLAVQVSQTWVAFARTGNPNHGGLPQWPAYDSARRATMAFNVPSKVVDDLQGEARKILES